MWKSEPGVTLDVPLRYLPLEVTVLQKQSGKEKKELGKACQEIEGLRMQLGSNHVLSLNLQPGNAGTVEFTMSLQPDEPITAGEMLAALLRPITECVLLKCILMCCCFPCLISWSRGARRAKPSASKRTTSAFSAGSARRPGQPGSTWRWLLRIVGLSIVVSALLHIVLLILSRDQAERDRASRGMLLFIKAKLLGWFITEPGALL